jgi:hypothetical protein
MPPPVDPHALEPLVEMLVETGDPGARDRLLLDAPFLLGIAPAAALWRVEPVRRGAPGIWREVLARGPAHLLPDAQRVAAVALGAQPAELAGHGTVLVAGSGELRRALCLGGLLGEHEPIVDLLEALLCTHAALEEAWQPAPDRLHGQLAPALPTTPPTGAASPGMHARLRHDVRNHHASIRSTRELLERFGPRLTEPEREHFHAVLEREVRRASDLLVRSVRQGASTPGAGASPAPVVRDVVDTERAACAAAAVEIVLEVDPLADGIRIPLSEVDLDRVLRNLLVNARQALEGAGRPGSIRVDVRTRDGALAIQVADDGPGLAQAALGELWEEGYTSGKQGSGLGLAVVRDLVVAAGGTVDAGAAAGGGACFTVVCPFLDADAETQKKP